MAERELPPYRDHYYLSYFPECQTCRSINLQYNKLDRLRFNHIVHLHSNRRPVVAPAAPAGPRGRGAGRRGRFRSTYRGRWG